MPSGVTHHYYDAKNIIRCVCDQCKTQFFYADPEARHCPVCGAAWEQPESPRLVVQNPRPIAVMA